MKSFIEAARSESSSHTDFRLFLQAELARRCARNPQYSLRAFANYLGMDHSTLSQLLRGRRAMTERAIRKIGSSLGLERAAVEEYVEQLLTAGDPVTAVPDPHTMAGANAELIAEWYHFAILEMTHLRGFLPNSPWIASSLGVTVDAVNLAITRLTRLGLLEMESRERWVDTLGDATVSLAGSDSETLGRVTAQARQLLLAALQRVSPSRRYHRSTTFALPRSKVPELVGLLEQLSRDIGKLLDGSPDDVYRLDIGLFPVTTFQRMQEDAHGTPGDALADSLEETR